MNFKEKQKSHFEMKWHPVAISVLLALPVIAHASDINMKDGSITSTNNVSVVNINKANDNGLSHNLYDKLNVDKNGLIFNNNLNESNTVLAGKIQGNTNLTSGSAKVILNEVTSKNSSVINGMMEIAGDKADLIIANPNGITVKGSGTINAGKLTLTTGTPDVTNDQLAGYSVNGGTITLGQLDTNSPTEILARNVVVTDKVTTDELNIIAGNNYVNARGEATGFVRATGSRNTNSIDVAALGGMYAKKISLISTESGIGVRNLGIISGGPSGVTIDSKGQLINSNAKITSSGKINIKTNGTLNNTTGTITSSDTIALDTSKNSLLNSRSGNILTAGNLYINSGALDNVNGKMAATGVLAVDTNNATLTNSGKGKKVGIEASAVALKTGTLNNYNGQIQGGSVGINSGYFNNNNGAINSLGVIEIESTGNVDNIKGLLRSSDEGYTKISATGTVNNSRTKSADTSSNDSLGIISGQSVQILAGDVSNNGGQIASSGNVTLESKNAIDNYAGKIVSLKNINLKGSSLRNDTGGISGSGGVVSTVSGNLTNYIGVISSDEGDLSLNANTVNNHGGIIKGKNISISAASDMVNNNSLMVAEEKIEINAKNNINNMNGNSFDSAFGLYFGISQQKGGMIGKEGVSLTAKNIYNNNSRIVAEYGPLNMISTGNIDNTRALLTSGKSAVIKASGIFYNNYATTYSVDDMSIDAAEIRNQKSGSFIDNNASGIIATDNNLSIGVANSLVNYGWISSLGNSTINVKNGSLYNKTAISSEKSLSVSARDVIENTGAIFVSNGDLTLSAGRNMTNSANSSMGGENVTLISNNDFTNSGKVSSRGDLAIRTNANLYNHKTITSDGNLSVTANSIYNNNSVISTIGDAKLISVSNLYNISGNISSSRGSLVIDATKGVLDNTRGILASGADATIKVGNVFYNNYATTQSVGDLSLTASTLYNYSNGNLENNTATGLIHSDKNLAINVDNNFTNYGWISSKDDMRLDVTKGAMYNQNTLSSGGALSVSAYSGLTNAKNISALGNMKLASTYFTNNGNASVTGENIQIAATADINNRGSIVSEKNLEVSTTANVYNYLNMFGGSLGKFTANRITNSGKNAVLGGKENAVLSATQLNDTGIIVGM